MWLHSSVGKASHRYRGGHGFKSRWSPDFFRLLLSNCLNWKINCDDHSSLSSTTPVQIWLISYILHITKRFVVFIVHHKIVKTYIEPAFLDDRRKSQIQKSPTYHNKLGPFTFFLYKLARSLTEEFPRTSTIHHYPTQSNTIASRDRFKPIRIGKNKW